jgi:integrase
MKTSTPHTVDRTSTFQELADEYLRRHARAPYKRESSIRNDRSMLKRIILRRLGSKKVAAVSRRQIEDLRDSLSATKYQANRVLALLSRMFSLCEEWDSEVDSARPPLRNPVRHVKRLEEEKCERWLRREELKRLLRVLRRHSDQASANAVRLIVLTGCRKMEALAAEWTEFDLAESIWTKPSHHVKNRTRHHVALNADACLLLRRMKRRAKGPYLFPGRPGVRDTRSDLYRFWNDVRQKAQLPDVRIHDLRHTFASHLVSGGESLELVGELLGHTDPRTTQRYAHLASQPLRDASNRFAKLYREAGGRRATVAKRQ